MSVIWTQIAFITTLPDSQNVDQSGKRKTRQVTYARMTKCFVYSRSRTGNIYKVSDNKNIGLTY